MPYDLYMQNFSGVSIANVPAKVVKTHHLKTSFAKLSALAGGLN